MGFIQEDEVGLIFENQSVFHSHKRVLMPVYTFIKTHQIVQCGSVSFAICKVCLSPFKKKNKTEKQ